MIAMLGHLAVDIEVSDAGMETAKSNNYREMSRDTRDANSVLVAIQEETIFSYKDKWKFINLFI